MKTILYVHGLSSSGNSRTVNIIRRLLPEYHIIAPDLPFDPQEALTLLNNLCDQKQPDLIVGSSMGGMFAQKLKGYKKILINPAFHVSVHMRQIIGTETFYNPRKDGIQTYEITPELCDAYENMEKVQFDDVDQREMELTHALFGRNDLLVNCQEEYKMHYPYFTLFDGEHSLTEEEIAEVLIPLIEGHLK